MIPIYNCTDTRIENWISDLSDSNRFLKIVYWINFDEFCNSYAFNFNRQKYHIESICVPVGVNLDFGYVMIYHLRMHVSLFMQL